MRHGRLCLGTLWTAIVCWAAIANAGIDDPSSSVMSQQTASNAGPLTTDAEVAWRAGRFREAASLFARARAAAPLDVAPARGACRLALAVGDQTTAREACQRTFLLGGTAEDMRNRVASLVSGSTAPTMDDLAVAFLLADGAVRVAPKQLWGYLALSEIAARIGDREMSKATLRDLARVAPEHELTRRAVAVAKIRVSPWIWLGRALFAGFLIATALHAMSRPRRSSRRRAVSATAALLLIVFGALGAVRAAPPEAASLPPEMNGLPIDDAKPETSVPTPDAQIKNPLVFGYFLQDLLARAQDATKRGDHAAAARYYGALAKAVPTRSYAFVKRCESFEAMGDRRGALDACREALYKEGVTVGDYSRFVHLVLAKGGSLSEDDRQDLDAVLAHMEKDPAGAIDAQKNRCEVALRIHDMPALERCSVALARSAPSDAATISFQWALAIERHDIRDAAGMIERARGAGVSASGLDAMKRTTRGMIWRTVGRAVLWIGGAGLVLALAAVMLRRKGWLRRLARQPVGVTGSSEPG